MNTTKFRVFRALTLTALIICTAGEIHAFSDAANLSCTAYIYDDLPFITAHLKINPDGKIDSSGEVEHFGQKKYVPVYNQTVSPGERYNVLLGDPGDQLRLVVFDAPAGATSWNGKLINDESPAMKEMRADCIPPQ
jgi:hypothetical protein